jgi:hypothetical protein
MSSVAESAPAVESRPASRRRSRGPSVADLKNQLASAYAGIQQLQVKLDAAEAKLLAKPATATPAPGGLCPEALQPDAEGVIRIWIMTNIEGYRVKLIHLGPDGAGWEMVKWSDGTRYHLHQADGDLIHCDCPGGAAHGPRCGNGQGCKHARFLRALRRLLVSPS